MNVRPSGGTVRSVSSLLDPGGWGFVSHPQRKMLIIHSNT